MRKCVICGHGLREFICIEADPDNAPYYMSDICVPCAEKIIKNFKEFKRVGLIK